MIEKIEVVDRIEWREDGHINVRKATKYVEDGVIVSKNYHRHVVLPGDDFSQEDARVQHICAMAHTPDVVQSHLDRVAALDRRPPTP